MQKKIAYVLLASLLLLYNLRAQSLFTKIVDANNPVTTFFTAGIYKGAAWVDIDNDGDLDLFASPNKLFRNDSLSFIQLPDLAFIPVQNVGGSSWADLDNDGDLDVIIAANPSSVFTNNGLGIFSDVTSQLPQLSNYPAWGCAIGNLDNDAFPDFIFAHAAGFHQPGPFPSKLFISKNNNISPVILSGYTLTDSVKPYTVPYWSDFDVDGDLDLFVASGPGGTAGYDYCYRNLKIETGQDTLEQITNTLFAQHQQDGQCYNFIDYDNDCDFDLCLTNYAGAPSRFYKNDNGTYVSLTLPFTATANNLSNCWGDYDNDGDIDVLISNDNTPLKYYQNMGGGNFANAISIGTAGACGITNGDYDKDGDLDFFAHGSGAARALYRNDSTSSSNGFCFIKLIGTISNKSAIGALVKLKATLNGISTWQMREVSAQNSFQSMNDIRVHFGLANASLIDSIVVKWPSGLHECFIGISINQLNLLLLEGSGIPLSINSYDIKKDNNFQITPNPASDLAIINVSSTNSKTLSILNAEGNMVFEEKFSEKIIIINTQLWPTGIYVAHLFDNGNTSATRIIITR